MVFGFTVFQVRFPQKQTKIRNFLPELLYITTPSAMPPALMTFRATRRHHTTGVVYARPSTAGALQSPASSTPTSTSTVTPPPAAAQRSPHPDISCRWVIDGSEAAPQDIIFEEGEGEAVEDTDEGASVEVQGEDGEPALIFEGLDTEITPAPTHDRDDISLF